jgi:aspartate aminotransferase
MACLDAGDEVIIPEPFYANYNGFAVAAGVKVVPITSHIENGFALPPIEDFEKVITERTKGIVICNPNNPTGYSYSEAEMQQLKDLILSITSICFPMKLIVSLLMERSSLAHASERNRR